MEAVRREWSIGEMLAGMNRGRVIRSILLLLNLLLVLSIWLSWRSTPESLSATEASAAAAPSLQLPSSPLRRLSRDHYRELVTRPLFWAERRAQEKASPVEVSAPNQPLAFALIGVVMSPQSSHALLSKPGSKEVVKVQPGDIVEGWQVEAMAADSVRLSRGSESRVITLDEKRTNKQ